MMTDSLNKNKQEIDYTLLESLCIDWTALPLKQRRELMYTWYDTFRVEAHLYLKKFPDSIYIWTLEEVYDIKDTLTKLVEHLGYKSFEGLGPTSEEFEAAKILLERIPKYIKDYKEYNTFKNLQGLLFFIRFLADKLKNNYRGQLAYKVATETPGLIRKYLLEPDKIILSKRLTHQVTQENRFKHEVKEKDGYLIIILPILVTPSRVNTHLKALTKDDKFKSYIDTRLYEEYILHHPELIYDNIERFKTGGSISFQIPADLNKNLFTRVLSSFIFKKMLDDARKQS